MYLCVYDYIKVHIYMQTDDNDDDDDDMCYVICVYIIMVVPNVENFMINFISARINFARINI